MNKQTTTESRSQQTKVDRLPWAAVISQIDEKKKAQTHTQPSLRARSYVEMEGKLRKDLHQSDKAKVVKYWLHLVSETNKLFSVWFV